jgi:hypothetical protein
MNRRNKRDTIGWQGELLVMDILKRDALNLVVHNSQEDADDPLIGVSLHGFEPYIGDFRIALPDFAVTNRGGTLFTSNIPSKSYFIETKTKTYFGSYQNTDRITTGFDNWDLELYHRLAEECGQLVEIYFVQIFPLAQAVDAIDHCDALSGIYKADIRALYQSRWRWHGMAYWPVQNSVLTLLNTMNELAEADDTRDRVLALRRIAKRDSTIWNPDFKLVEEQP